MTINVVLISPGFPADNGHFTQALHALPGVRVLGVGDQPAAAMEPAVRAAIDDHLVVKDLWNEEQTVAEVGRWLGQLGVRPDRVECLWEIGVVLAARMREAFDVPGLRVEQAVTFRDKEVMKATLDAAGIRTPHHYRARSRAEVEEAARAVGYPLIVKPIDGAGSEDTHTARSEEELQRVIEAVAHVPEVSVEEFIEGKEFTYDAILADGETLFENVAWYRPKPLVARQNPWMSPQAVCLADLDQPDVAPGVELGRRALKALGYRTGMAHMEWYLSDKTGEAIFGEVGARAPGGRLSHGMNYACDGDVFQLWAEAIARGSSEQSMERRYIAALVFKRAHGDGTLVTRIEGLEPILARDGEHLPVVELVPIGAPRRDWTQVVTGDGWCIARHNLLTEALRIADDIGRDVRIHCDT